jgi:hypothetical protein
MSTSLLYLTFINTSSTNINPRKPHRDLTPQYKTSYPHPSPSKRKDALQLQVPKFNVDCPKRSRRNKGFPEDKKMGVETKISCLFDRWAHGVCLGGLGGSWAEYEVLRRRGLIYSPSHVDVSNIIAVVSFWVIEGVEWRMI